MTHCGLTYSASLQEPRDVNLGSLWQSVVQSSQGSESCKAGTLDWTDYVTEQIPLGFEFNFGCSTHTGFRISSNGWISFMEDDDWGWCGKSELPEGPIVNTSGGGGQWSCVNGVPPPAYTQCSQIPYDSKTQTSNGEYPSDYIAVGLVGLTPNIEPMSFSSVYWMTIQEDGKNTCVIQLFRDENPPLACSQLCMQHDYSGCPAYDAKIVLSQEFPSADGALVPGTVQVTTRGTYGARPVAQGLNTDGGFTEWCWRPGHHLDASYFTVEYSPESQRGSSDPGSDELACMKMTEPIPRPPPPSPPCHSEDSGDTSEERHPTAETLFGITTILGSVTIALITQVVGLWVRGRMLRHVPIWHIGAVPFTLLFRINATMLIALFLSCSPFAIGKITCIVTCIIHSLGAYGCLTLNWRVLLAFRLLGALLVVWLISMEVLWEQEVKGCPNSSDDIKQHITSKDCEAWAVVVGITPVCIGMLVSVLFYGLGRAIRSCQRLSEWQREQMTSTTVDLVIDGDGTDTSDSESVEGTSAVDKARYRNAVAFQMADGSYILGVPEGNEQEVPPAKAGSSSRGSCEGELESEMDDLSSMQSMETDISSDDSNYSLTDPLLSPRLYDE